MPAVKTSRYSHLNNFKNDQSYELIGEEIKNKVNAPSLSRENQI